MTITKKLTTTLIASLTILGMVLAATPAHAGFFDWFGSTPLNQEAQAIKSFDSRSIKASESFSRSAAERKAEPVKIIEKEEKSPAVNFFQSVFSRSTKRSTPSANIDLSSRVEDVKNVNSASLSESKPNVKNTDITYQYVKNVLRYKDEGREVVYVQQVLSALGYYKGKAHGTYDRATVEAVKSFQRYESPVQLVTTGQVFGKRTVEKFNKFVDKLNGSPALVGGNCQPGDIPWIELITPNGGESYLEGEQITVKWTTCNMSEDVLIHFTPFYGPSLDQPLVTPYPGVTSLNTGLASFVVPVGHIPAEGWQYGANFKLFAKTNNAVYNGGLIGVDTISDDYFKIAQSYNSQSCLTSSQLDSILNLMDSFGATQQSIDAVDDVLSTGSTNIVMTANSGLTPAQVDAIQSLLTSFGCDTSTTYLVNDILTYVPGSDVLGQISFWYGKVNVHREVGGSWETDPDGVAGAGTYAQWGDEGWIDRKVEYCQRFWPNTTSVEEAGIMEIHGWYPRYNVGNPLTSMKMAYNCLGQESNVVPLSFEWLTVPNTTLTNNANHLVAELKVTNNTNQDITFENADGNQIWFDIQIGINDDTDNTQQEPLRFKDEYGVTLDTMTFPADPTGTGNSTVHMDFSNSNFVIAPNTNRYIFVYADTTDFEDDNDYFQMFFDNWASWQVQYGVNGSGNIIADSYDIIQSMPDRYAQVHVNPS